MPTAATADISIKTVRATPSYKPLAKRVESNGAQAAYNFARNATKEMKVRAPVRTGYLKSQIKWERVEKGKFLVFVDGDVNTRTGAFYAVYVEYGTRNMAAQPFFRPGIEVAKRVWKAEMKAVFRD